MNLIARWQLGHCVTELWDFACGSFCTMLIPALCVQNPFYALISSSFKLSGAVFLIYATRSRGFCHWPLASLFHHLLPYESRDVNWPGCRSDTMHTVAFPTIPLVHSPVGATLPFLGNSRPRKCASSGQEKGRDGKEDFTKLQVCLPMSVSSLPGSLEAPSGLMPTLHPWAWTLALHGCGSLRNF